MFTADPLPTLLAGLATGVVFGFLLQKGQVTRYATIVGQFLWVDHTVLRIMLTAIVVGATGVWGMLSLGWIEHLHVKPALLAANATGGLIFGVGMASLGYCPGTGVGAAAEGSRHAWFGVVGMVFGAMAYAFAWPALDRGFLHVGELGKITLADLTGASPWVFIAGLTVIALAAFKALAPQRAVSG